MTQLQTFLFTLQLILAVSLILLVLLQPSTDEASFTSSNISNPDQMFTGNSAMLFVNKLTYYMIFFLIANSLALGLTFKQKQSINSLLDDTLKINKTIDVPVDSSVNPTDIPKSPKTQAPEIPTGK